MARWYQTWWGVILLSVGGVGLIGGGVLVFLIGKYWWQIRQGQGAFLAQEFTETRTHFTASLINNQSPVGTIDRAALELSDEPFLGRSDAPTVIVEFVDFKCPNCRTAAPIMRQVMGKYGDRVKLIIRHIPVESTHPGATDLAVLGFCAQAQQRFWPLSDWLFDHQDDLSVPLSADDVSRIVAATDLDRKNLELCRKSPQALQKIRADYFDGLRFGVQGTPTFFINGHKAEGVIPLEGWQKILESAK